jgi:hypothetical protein
MAGPLSNQQGRLFTWHKNDGLVKSGLQRAAPSYL